MAFQMDTSTQVLAFYDAIDFNHNKNHLMACSIGGQSNYLLDRPAIMLFYAFYFISFNRGTHTSGYTISRLWIICTNCIKCGKQAMKQAMGQIEMSCTEYCAISNLW